jgi:hypothetical protein
MKYLITLLVALVLGVQPVSANDEPLRYNGISGSDGLSIIKGVAFEYDVLMNIGQLMREPVVGTRFRWLINVEKSQATIPAMGIGDDPYETVPLAALGSQAPSKIRIYNVKIEYQLSTAAGTMYLLSDAGDPAQGDGKSWSFNVPESPNWTRLFHSRALRNAQDSRNFVPKATAQKAMSGHIRMVDARILDADISFFDLHQWYMRNTDAAEAIATEKALEDIRIGVFRSFGYEVRGVNAAFFPPSKALGTVRSGIGQMPSIMSDYLKRAGPRLAKLMNVPDHLQTNPDSSIYDATVRSARADITAARSNAKAYRSPDKDPRRFRAGEQPRFGGSYSVREIDDADWIVDTSRNNAKVHRLRSDERLIGTSYFIDRYKVKAVCRNNELAIPLRDPASLEIIHSVRLPCPINGSSIGSLNFSASGDPGHPFFTVDVRQSRTRSVQKSYTCTSCGSTKRRRETVEQIDYTEYRVNPDLSFTKVKDYTWTEPTIGCGLTLCRN